MPLQIKANSTAGGTTTNGYGKQENKDQCPKSFQFHKQSARNAHLFEEPARLNVARALADDQRQVWPLLAQCNPKHLKRLLKGVAGDKSKLGSDVVRAGVRV